MRPRSPRPFRVLAAPAVVLGGAAVGLLAGHARAAPPAAPVTGQRALYAGVDVADPYRGLERTDDPVVQQWLRAQAAYARATLDRLPGLAALRERIEALDRSLPERITWLARGAGGRVAYLKRGAADPYPRLYVRDAAAAPERLLFDPQRAAGGVRPIDNASLSPDGRFVAVVSSPGGSERGTMEVLDTTTGARVGNPISNVWGELAATWLPDSQRFAYATVEDPARPYERQRLVLRAVAGDATADRPLLGWKVPGAPPANETDWLALHVAAGSDWLVATQAQGVNGVERVWAARLKDLDNAKKFRWKAVATEADGLRGASPDALGVPPVQAGDYLYARTFVGAGRYAIVRYDLSDRTPKPEVLVPEQAGTIASLVAARDALYYVVRGPTTGALWRLAHGEKVDAAREIALPYAGSVAFVDASAEQPGVTFLLQGWFDSPRIYAYVPGAARGAREAAADAAPVDTGLLRPATIDTRPYAATDTECPARDGVRVPMTILARRDLRRDRVRPTLLVGYGGYGITEVAAFRPTWLAWLERGGAIAVVNPRGSGAYGEAWYRAGVGASRANTWHDAIDCAASLIAERWTEPARLAIWGTSMGGVFAGRAITERPDLFAAALLQVGILDAVRFVEGTTNGPNHEPEMGTPKTHDGVTQLVAASAYHQVRDGVRYPAALLTTAPDDARVAPWQSFKMAARLAAATIGGPVLLRIDGQGGHGHGMAADSRNARLADQFAFVLWQAGDPAFQPPRRSSPESAPAPH